VKSEAGIERPVRGYGDNYALSKERTAGGAKRIKSSARRVLCAETLQQAHAGLYKGAMVIIGPACLLNRF